MLIFPKLPKLRGRRAEYVAEGQVSTLEKNPYWRAGDSGQMFEGAKLYARHADADRVELAVLNFAKLHAAAAHGEISLKRVDSHGYSWPVAAWKKTAPGDWTQVR